MSPERVEYYSRWCGPAVVASALGITREEAARRLAEGRKYVRSYTKMSRIGEVVGRPVEQRKDWLTFTQFRKANPGRSYIVRASRHFIHVHKGRIREDNGLPKARGRVTHVIWLEDA